MTCSETAVHVSAEMQRTLRSSPRNKQQDDELEEEVALEKAEEKLMEEEEDEEIESCDESGKPVVDTEKLERRMMTVALVKSVVETSGSNGNSAKEEGADKKHTYGLRKRGSKISRDSSDDEERPQTRRRRTQPLKKRSIASARGVAPVGNSSSTVATAGPMSQAIHSTQQVPNPLLQPTHFSAQARVAAASTLSLVPCPLPAGESSKEAGKPDGASSAQVAMKANEFASTRRGRIFSIDIDPEGLEFPDMNIDVAMNPDAVRNRSTSIEQGSQADSSKSTSVTFKHQGEHKDSLDVSLSSTGRGRAMSFEFFSFGINADEPLPPAPVISGTELAPAYARPRGDSIIFDPDSFRDGGVLEEHALIKGRATSMDLTAPEELALMNTPGFAPAPTIVPDKPYSRSGQSTRGGSTKRSSNNAAAKFSHADRTSASSNKNKHSSSNMATLPSTLTGSTGEPSHTTFQMDLLNKDGRIGIYLPEARKARIAKFHSKRKMRIWRKRIKYDCRKKLADSRPRIKGRFVKRSDCDE